MSKRLERWKATHPDEFKRAETLSLPKTFKEGVPEKEIQDFLKERMLEALGRIEDLEEKLESAREDYRVYRYTLEMRKQRGA